jgi:hypothetical protein
MAISIKPEDLRAQGTSETVVYLLPWDAWDQELAKQQRDAKVKVEILRGTLCTVELLEDDRAKRCARVAVRSGAQGGLYQITRTVTTKGIPPEKRRRSFKVLVE